MPQLIEPGGHDLHLQPEGCQFRGDLALNFVLMVGEAGGPHGLLQERDQLVARGIDGIGDERFIHRVSLFALGQHPYSVVGGL